MVRHERHRRRFHARRGCRHRGLLAVVVAGVSAIPAASVSLKTLADGTLRMTFDIEPAQAKDAFSLFAAPGTPVAIAALQVGYAAKSPEPEPQKEPIGPLCKWLVFRCGDPEFWRWLEAEVTDGTPVESSDEASRVVKLYLDIKSRRDVDTCDAAHARCKSYINAPYQRWLLRRQA